MIDSRKFKAGTGAYAMADRMNGVVLHSNLTARSNSEDKMIKGTLFER
jgi:hypothetical protein